MTSHAFLISPATLADPTKILGRALGDVQPYDFRNIIRMQLAQPRFEFRITGRRHFENREYFRTRLHLLIPEINDSTEGTRFAQATIAFSTRLRSIFRAISL